MTMALLAPVSIETEEMSVCELTLPTGNGTKVCVGGGAGFIITHIVKCFKEAGYHWKKNEFMEDDEFCDVFIHDDIRKLDIAIK